MNKDTLSKDAYNLHTVPSKASWSNRIRKFIGIITNLDSDLEELRSLLQDFVSPWFDFTGSCLEANIIWIRIFDSQTTLRMWIHSDINPDIIKKWLISEGLTQQFSNAPFSLKEDYTENFSARIFRILVPAYDVYIKWRYREYLKKSGENLH